MSFNAILNGSGMKTSRQNELLYPFNKVEYLDIRDISGYSRGSMLGYAANMDTVKLAYPKYLNAWSQLYHAVRQSNGLEQGLINYSGFVRCSNGTDDYILAEYCGASSETVNKDAGKGDYAGYEKVLLKIADKTGDIQAAVFDPITGKTKPYMITCNKPKKGEYDACPVLYAQLIRSLFAKGSVSSALHSFQEDMHRALSAGEDSVSLNAIVAGDIEYAIKYSNVLDSEVPVFTENGIDLTSGVKQSYPMLHLEDKPNYDDESVIGDISGFRIAWGYDPKPVKATASVNLPKSRKLCDLKGKFDFCPKRVRTVQEKGMLAEMARTLDPNMEVSETLIDIASDIKMSTNMSFRFRDYMLKGATGTGKTTMVKVLGLLVNLPVVTFSCDPDTDQLALGVSVIPNGNSEDDNSVKISEDAFFSKMPTPEDIAFDPIGAFKVITGETNEQAKSLDCLKAVMDKWVDIKEKQANGFRYVYSNIAKAMKNGWIIEVQEPTVIQRPGVLTSLNALTDDCAKMDLANGETINRHPDAIMVYTTNLNLEGCFDMNQAQKSRFSQRTIALPDDEVIVKRLMESTGYKDKATAKKMVRVYDLAYKIAQSKNITDGAIDFRALQAWATSNMMHPTTPYKNGVNEFIEKCTDDESIKPYFIANALQIEFVPEDTAGGLFF